MRQCKKQIIVLVQEDASGIVLDRVLAARRAVHCCAPGLLCGPHLAAPERIQQPKPVAGPAEQLGTLKCAALCLSSPIVVRLCAHEVAGLCAAARVEIL